MIADLKPYAEDSEFIFTSHAYMLLPLRTLEEIRADILTIEQEAEGILDESLKSGAKP